MVTTLEEGTRVKPYCGTFASAASGAAPTRASGPRCPHPDLSQTAASWRKPLLAAPGPPGTSLTSDCGGARGKRAATNSLACRVPTCYAVGQLSRPGPSACP